MNKYIFNDWRSKLVSIGYDSLRKEVLNGERWLEERRVLYKKHKTHSVLLAREQ